MCFQPTAVQVYALCLRRTDIFSYSVIYAMLSPYALQRQHSYIAHIADSVNWWLEQTYTFHRLRAQVQLNDYQIFTSPSGGNLSRSMMSSSLPAPHSTPSDHLYDIMETTSLATLQVKSVRREEPSADALYGPGGFEKHRLENGISRESEIY